MKRKIVLILVIILLISCTKKKQSEENNTKKFPNEEKQMVLQKDSELKNADNNTILNTETVTSQSIKDFITDKTYYFDVIDNNTNWGFIVIENGIIACGGAGSFYGIFLSDIEYETDYIDIYYLKTGFNYFEENENIKYRNWDFPEKRKVRITLKELKKIKDADESILVTPDNQFYKTECNAIVIQDSNVYDDKKMQNIISTISKRSEVILSDKQYDENNSIWYQIKISDEASGWIQSQNVKIYFPDGYKDDFDKNGILESIQ